MRTAIPILLLFLSLTAKAHEMWLQPAKADLQPLQVDIIVGQNFRGAKGVWIPPSVARAETIRGPQRQAITGRFGDLPAITIDDASGLDRLIYQSEPETLRYNQPEKFQSFGEHKGYPDLLARHQQRNLAGRIVELYTRYAKLLVAQDQLDQLMIEFVVARDRASAQLFWQDQPLPNHRVHLYIADQVQLLTTDASGRIPLPQIDQAMLLDAVVIEPIVEDEASWHSHWASTYIAQELVTVP